MPKKEGTIKPYKRVEEIARKETNKIIFLDNNILASSFGISEIEYLAGSNYRVDFNQGLDARLVDDNVAKLLVKVRWLRYIRFSCDTKAMLDIVLNAVERLRKYGYKKEVFVYVLGIDAADTLYRLNELKKYNLVPFMQPYAMAINLFHRSLKELPAGAINAGYLKVVIMMIIMIIKRLHQ